MSEERFLKSTRSGRVYPWTRILSIRTDMVPCTRAGVRIITEDEEEPVVENVQSEDDYQPVKPDKASKASNTPAPPAAEFQDETEEQDPAVDFHAMTKEAIEEYGRELDPPIELDRRKTKDKMIAELEAHIAETG